MPSLTGTSRLASIREKVVAGERLSSEEGLYLSESVSLLELGRLADQARRRKVGDEVFFITNRHINYTNVCKNRCVFCAFSRDPGENGAFTLTREEILEKARESLASGITELHIVGGEHPTLPYEEIKTVVRDLHSLAPHVHIKAFTASEIAHWAELGGMSVREVLLDLKETGLGSLPGGGAEIFSTRVRELVCPKKISGTEWLEVHKMAHRCGLRSNATMLYGHVETAEERIDHLVRLREAQDETGGFQAFVALAFQPANTGLSHLPATTGVEDLRVLALARLMLDNFRHIKAYWIMLGLKLVQVSLSFGVNDVDGTIVEERIAHMAGSEVAQMVGKEELVRLIKDAGRVPVERNTLYEVVERCQ